MKDLFLDYKSLADLLNRSAAEYGSKPLFFFPDDNTEISYEQFLERVNKTANMLKDLGIGRKDRVAVMLPNMLEFPVLWMAITRIAAVIVPTNNSYRSVDLEYVLKDSGAKALFIHEDSYHVFEEIREKCSELDHVVSVGRNAIPGTIDYQEYITGMSGYFDKPGPGLDDLANIQYTSGTTGFPKGCMLTHKYWLQMGKVASDYLAAGKNDRDLCAQPFYYMDAQWNTVLCMLNGIALVVMKRFSASRHWKICRDYKVTFFYCIGAMPAYLASRKEDPENEKNHNLRAVICSGINPQMHSYYEKRWNVPWREAFGMTETGVDLLVPWEDTDSVGSGAIGKPISSKEARVVNPAGREVAKGETGQLLLKGEPMMIGYWNKPEATSEILKDGWLHTGDIVYESEKGYYHWVGRIKDMIRRSGENISAAEVENVIIQHPQVEMVAVVPVPDPLRGEEVKAYLVLNKNTESRNFHPEDIISFAREKLSSFKMPRYIEFVESLPLTASERVEKHKLLKEKDDLRLGSYDSLDKTWRNS